jgi:hypothetical protein
MDRAGAAVQWTVSPFSLHCGFPRKTNEISDFFAIIPCLSRVAGTVVAIIAVGL